MITNQNTREEIIKELELGGLPEEAQNEIISKFAENLLKSIAMTMLDTLPEDKRGEFETLVDTGDSAQVFTFLKQHVPNADILIQAELRKSIAEIK